MTTHTSESNALTEASQSVIFPELLRRFDTLMDINQSGVMTILEKLHLRGFGHLPIRVALEESDALGQEEEYYSGPVGRDHRMTSITWIATDANYLIGDNISVEFALKKLKESGYAAWRDGQ